ncbi:MAG: PKD domain-containing protein [Candidatus Altimarinota bacterium]
MRDNLDFDTRVKRVLEIESILGYLIKFGLASVGILVVATLLGFTPARAQSEEEIRDIFIVPVVRATGQGAEVFQPQTGEGYTGNRANNSLGAGYEDYVVGDFNKTSLVLQRSYVEPKHDPFMTGTAYSPVPVNQVKTASGPAAVSIKASNNINGQEGFGGTTNTIFKFTANAAATSGIKNNRQLEYRWDFQNDGKPDSYFSVIPNIQYVFKEAGLYTVKVEVLDGDGKISKAFAQVNVVDNEAPKAKFTVNSIAAPMNSILRFDTSLSSDSQSGGRSLLYRFDWNNDRVWDTTFQNKTTWNRLFNESGEYIVNMEARDPEGLSSYAQIAIQIFDDQPPVANMNIRKIGEFRYEFDGSQSFDDFSGQGKLKYRWDLDYNGVNDLIFTSGWSTTPKYTGNLGIGSSGRVRLQVMDQQGFTSDTIAALEVPWTQEYLNMAWEVALR